MSCVELERSRFCRPFGNQESGIEVAERRWLWLASVRRRLVQRRSPLGCKPRAVVALRGAVAAGVGPLPWYSKRVEAGGFLPAS